MSDDEANEFVGYPEEKISNVRIIQDGKVRTKVQAFFTYNRSASVIEYTIPKNGIYIDNPDVILSSLKKAKDGYKLTLYNFSDKENDAEILLHKQDKKINLHFGKFEIKIIEI